ncbi:RHS repeat-associated core domain-containing protein [Bordetella bronchialis]|uniref:RHS repeat-associated core domain-containing protein n=1 Tax=Bordetella bronchialis TaxID=463025 RepID=UPI003CFD4CD6
MTGGHALAYTGSTLDGVTGGYALGNGYRTFLPALMRFTAPDADSPFALGGPNGYAYCLGNPVHVADPTGHIPMIEPTDFVPRIDELAQWADKADLKQLPTDLGRWLGEDEPAAPHASAPLAPAAGPGPGTSAADQAGGVAAHAGGAAPSPDAPVGQLLAKLGVPRSIPAPAIVLRELPQDDLGLKRFFNTAYGLGYVTLSPEGPEKSAILFTIQPRIALQGRLLDHYDPDVVQMLKRFGASRGRPKGWAHMGPYTVSLTIPVEPGPGLLVALGGSRPGAHGFDPILLSTAQVRALHVRRPYTRAFRDRAWSLGLGQLF